MGAGVYNHENAGEGDGSIRTNLVDVGRRRKKTWFAIERPPTLDAMCGSADGLAEGLAVGSWTRGEQRVAAYS